MIGGKQDLSLHAGGCTYKGIVAHELIHALGFWFILIFKISKAIFVLDSSQILKKGFLHEQSRADRDNFVTVNYANIERGR